MFFSSRRRHTRYWRDWSSDVCSSDLPTTEFDELKTVDPAVGGDDTISGGLDSDYIFGGLGVDKRSEERRVGKESRSRWLPYHLKKKSVFAARKCNANPHNSSVLTDRK